jgi:hypothetical protein
MGTIRIRAKDGSVIDLDEIRKEQVFIGNPYAVDHAILIRHNTALLDALEAALSVQKSGDLAPEFQGFDNAISHVRSRAGMIEDSPVAD